MDDSAAGLIARQKLARLRSELAVYEKGLTSTLGDPKLRAIMVKMADLRESISDLEGEWDAREGAVQAKRRRQGPTST